MIKAIKEGIWLQGLLDDLRIEKDQFKINYDSMNAIYLAKNRVYHARTKHFDSRFHFIREILEEGDLVLKKITQRRIRQTCLLRWFQELSLTIIRTYFISFQLLEFSGAHLDEVYVA